MAKPKKQMDNLTQQATTPRRKKARKEEIIAAAARLFSEKSFHDVTMDQIANYVGVAKGTLYLYFDSKEKLYLEILEHTYQEIEAILEKEVAKNDPAPVKLKKILKLLLHFYFNHMDALTILSRDETHLIREHYEFTERWRHKRIDQYQEILEKGIKEGSFRPANTKLTAHIIFGLVGSVVYFYKSDKDAGEIADEVYTMIAEGITTHSSASGAKSAKQ